MTAPLIWMPTLDVRATPKAFQEWAIHRFLRSHRGQGHLIADTFGPWPSLEITEPVDGAHWYCTAPSHADKQASPADVTVEMTLPLGAGDQALHLLEWAQTAAPLRRLVVKRPLPSNLSQIAISLSTLKDIANVPIWLDVATFGWTAVSYLVARNPGFELASVDGTELWRLVRLAEWLGRPLAMGDLSDHEPTEIAALPRFGDEKLRSTVFKTLPIWGRSR